MASLWKSGECVLSVFGGRRDLDDRFKASSSLPYDPLVLLPPLAKEEVMSIVSRCHDLMKNILDVGSGRS